MSSDNILECKYGVESHSVIPTNYQRIIATAESIKLKEIRVIYLRFLSRLHHIKFLGRIKINILATRFSSFRSLLSSTI